MKSNIHMTFGLLLSLLLTSNSCSLADVKVSHPDSVRTNGEVSIYTTTTTRSSEFAKSSLPLRKDEKLSPQTITLNPAQRFQSMDGFGAAITGSTAYNLLKMSPQDRTRFLKETFSEQDGLGMSYIRIAIGCSDFSLSEYTCWDQQGKENFALQEEEKKYILPVLKEILAINPNLTIMASPWTAPKWMKVNNLQELKSFDSWTSGQLNPKYYADYAWYFVQWLKAMDSEGVHVDAITIQNEPLNRGNSASMYMSWQEQQAFIKQALGPQFKSAHLATKIYAFDHNYNYDHIADQNDYPLQIYKDDAAAAYLTGSAFHNYGGDKSELLDVHDQRPDKEIIFTETSIGEWNQGRDLDKRLLDDMREVALGTVNNWSKAVIVWNLLLDSEKGPNREGGCQTCYGAVDINKGNYKSLTRNSHYYIIGHLSAVVKPGATRIGTTGYTAKDLSYAAFQNTDGSYAFVLLNESAASQTLSINDGKRHFSYQVPAKSVVSYRWPAP